MSFKYMAWASEQKTGSPTKKLILLLLADRANDSGVSYPSQQRLADDCELSRSAINRNIKELEKMGLVTIQHRSQDGVKLPNTYMLQMEGVVAQDDRGSVTELHKPINKPINTKRENKSDLKDDKKTDTKLSEYEIFINNIKEIAPIKSRVTKTKEGAKLFKQLKDPQAVADAYILHQAEKGKYASRITVFMEDAEYHLSNAKAQATKQEEEIWM